MTTPDPDELLRQLDPGLAELKAKAEQAQELLAASGATTRSPDGAISVTIGPGGNLSGLRLTERAYQQPPEQLAAQIMRLAGQAQQQVGAQVMAAFGGLVGADSPAMSMLSEFLPPAPDEEPPPPEPDPYALPPEPVRSETPPPQPQRRPRPARRSDEDVEDDYDQGDLWD